MSAIEGASVRIKTMSDGTLQLTINIEPVDAIRAFTLFGAPGTPVALAALKVGHAMASDEPVAAPEPKGGPLSQWLAQRCNEPVFRKWAYAEIRGFSNVHPDYFDTGICSLIGVNRKREIDSDQYAPTRLKTLVMQPYAEWLKKRGAA